MIVSTLRPVERTLDVLAAPQTAAGGYLTAAGEPFAVFRQVEVGEAAEITPDGVAGPEALEGTVPGPAPQAMDAPRLPAPQVMDAARVPAQPVRTPRVGNPSTGTVHAAGGQAPGQPLAHHQLCVVRRPAPGGRDPEPPAG